MVGWYENEKLEERKFASQKRRESSSHINKYRSESIDVRRRKTGLRFIGRGLVGVGAIDRSINQGSRLTQEMLGTSGSRGCCLRHCRGSSRTSLLGTLSVTPRILG